jgi:hypothetical protein
MADEKKQVVAIGEVMIEMARGNDGRYGTACGGDTFNTAVYLARAGIEVAYATALGDDPYSDGIVSMATAEGIRTDLILRVKDDYDGAEPSGNSVATLLLLRLAEFTDRPDYRQAAENTLSLFSSRMRSAPHIMPQSRSRITLRRVAILPFLPLAGPP